MQFFCENPILNDKQESIQKSSHGSVTRIVNRNEIILRKYCIVFVGPNREVSNVIAVII